jgi:hypothetical protein
LQERALIATRLVPLLFDIYLLMDFLLTQHCFSQKFYPPPLKSADVLSGRPFCEEQPKERKGKKLRKLHVEHADLHIQKARPQK